MSENTTTTTLYLVRHGTTEYNAKFKYQGLADIPLNNLGHKQGELLTGYFKDIKIDLGVSSALTRAKQTLDYILAGHDETERMVEPDLHEINLGIFELRPVTEVGILFPEFQKNFILKPGELRVPRGETSKQVYDRMRDAILRIVKANQGKTIVMASHGFAIQTWLNYASNISAEDMHLWSLDNVAVSKFIFDQDLNIKIEFIGDTSHLKDEYKQNYDWEVLAYPAPLLLYNSGNYRANLAKNYVMNLIKKYKIRAQFRDLLHAPLYSEELDAVLSKEINKKYINKDLFLVTSDRAVTGYRKDEFNKILGV